MSATSVFRAKIDRARSIYVSAFTFLQGLASRFAALDNDAGMGRMETREPESLDEQVAALSRSSDRDSLFLQASLRFPGAPDRALVRVRNLSAGGMLAEGAAEVAEGGTVEVELKNVGAVAGRIVWVGEGKFGIAFDRPVNPQAVRRQVVEKSDLPPHLRRTGLERSPIYRRR